MIKDEPLLLSCSRTLSRKGTCPSEALAAVSEMRVCWARSVLWGWPSSSEVLLCVLRPRTDVAVTASSLRGQLPSH